MARKGRLFLPLEVNFLDDDRVIVLSDGAKLLYIAMALRAKALGSDGLLSEAQVSRLHRPRWKSELRALLATELVILSGETGEFFITGWFNHNDSIEYRNLKLAADRDRKQRKPSSFQPESARNPTGFPTTPRAESASQSREEKREVEHSARNAAVEPGPRCPIPGHDDAPDPCPTCEADRPNVVALHPRDAARANIRPFPADQSRRGQHA